MVDPRPFPGFAWVRLRAAISYLGEELDPCPLPHNALSSP